MKFINVIVTQNSVLNEGRVHSFSWDLPGVWGQRPHEEDNGTVEKLFVNGKVLPGVWGRSPHEERVRMSTTQT